MFGGGFPFPKPGMPPPPGLPPLPVPPGGMPPMPGMPGMPGPPGGMPWPPGGMPPAPPAPAAPGGVPPDVRDRYKCLREDIIKMEAAATEAENNGDSSGAKFKMMLLGDMNEKIKEMETEHPALLEPEPVEAVQAPQAINPHQMMPNFVPMTFTQQQALMYDQQQQMRGGEMDAEVKEFQEKYGLQDRHAYLLNDQLKNRNNTYEDDMWHLDEIMSRCNNAAQRADLLSMNVRWMAEGKFCGAYSPNPAVQKAAKKFKLDPPAACKLAHGLESREDGDSDIEKINKHLERSNKPSSLVMMFLKTLKAGGTIDDKYRPVAVGSWLHKQEQQNAADEKNQRSQRRGKGDGRRSPSRKRSRSRGRDRRDDRDKRRRGDSRDRGGGKSRDSGGSWNDKSWNDKSWQGGDDKWKSGDSQKTKRDDSRGR